MIWAGFTLEGDFLGLFPNEEELYTALTEMYSEELVNKAHGTLAKPIRTQRELLSFSLIESLDSDVVCRFIMLLRP